MPNRYRSPKRPIVGSRNQIVSHWAGWIKLFRHQFVRVMIQEDPPLEGMPGIGPNIFIYCPPENNMGRRFSIDLTEMTEDELNAFEKFVNDTIGLARPVVRLRDKVVGEMYEQGADDFNRFYRSPPQVVNRLWARDIDSQSVLSRLAHDAPGITAGRGANDPVSAASDEISESDSQSAVSGDNLSQTIGIEEIR